VCEKEKRKLVRAFGGCLGHQEAMKDVVKLR